MRFFVCPADILWNSLSSLSTVICYYACFPLWNFFKILKNEKLATVDNKINLHTG